MKRAALLVALLLAPVAPALAQPIDFSRGGPVEITAANGIEWHQNDQTVIASGNARAVRGGVTVTADKLIAYYRRKADAGTPGSRPAGGTSLQSNSVASRQGGPDQTGNNEIYRLEARGRVHIYTHTDEATGDRAIYDIDQAVMVLTGKDLRLVTPQDLITARDALEYWSQKHMAVARGDATVTTNDARQIAADTIVAYMYPPDAQPTAKPTASKPGPAAKDGRGGEDDLAASGKLERAEVFGNVLIRTPTQTVRGDRGVYVPDTGMARLAGNTRLTQGQNQVNGAGLEVNLNTGIYRLVSAPGDRVEGVVVPNDANAGQGAAVPPGAPAGAPK